MKDERENMEPEMVLFMQGESIRCEVVMEKVTERCTPTKSFDQTFSKSLMRGANPCGGNRALELIPSGEREVFAQKAIKN